MFILFYYYKLVIRKCDYMNNVLHLGLSYACNMRCEHCFVDKKRDLLSTEIICEIIDELYKRGLMILYYTYGEPLLAENLFDIMKYCQEKGIVQILMTNGYLMTEKIADSIKQYGVSNVYVSLDSSLALEHDKNRGIIGAYDKAINAIRILKKKNISVGISTAITEKNAEKLMEIYEIALREKVNIISFLRARNKNSPLMLSREKKEKYTEFVRFGIKQKKINLKFHDIELLDCLDEWKKEELISTEEFEKYYCMCCCHANNTVSIAPNGDVRNCNLTDHVIGNAIESSVTNILERNEENEGVVCCSTISK